MMHQPIEQDVFEDATDEAPLIFNCEVTGGDISFATNMDDEQIIEMLWAFLTKHETRH